MFKIIECFQLSWAGPSEVVRKFLRFILQKVPSLTSKILFIHVWLRYMTSPEATILKEFVPRPSRGQCPSRWNKTPTRSSWRSRRKDSQRPKSTRTNWSKTGPGGNRPKSGNRNRPKSIPGGRSRAETRSSAIPGPARSVLDW